MHLFVKITAVVAVALVVLLAIAFLVKILIAAALIAALVFAGMTIARLFGGRRPNAMVRYDARPYDARRYR